MPNLIQRKVTFTVRNAKGEPLPNKVTKFEVVKDVFSNGNVIPQQSVEVVSSSVAGHIGECEVDLYTLEGGFLNYRVTLYNRNVHRFFIEPGADATLDFFINRSLIPDQPPPTLALTLLMQSIASAAANAALKGTVQKLASAEALTDSIAGTSKQLLFTVPSGKRAFITDIWFYDGSGFPTRGSGGAEIALTYNPDPTIVDFGYYNVMSSMEGAINIQPYLPNPQTLGQPGEVFGLSFGEPGDDPRTVSITVLGFLIDA